MEALIQALGTARPEGRIDQAAAAEVMQDLLGVGQQDGRALSALLRRTRICQRASVLLRDSHDCASRQSFYPPARNDDDFGPSTARRMMRYAAEAGRLACAAGVKALNDAQAAASEITQIINVSCTGFFAPGVDIAMIKQLGLSPEVGRTQIGFMGCHGAINGLRVAKALVEADPNARVLLSAVELCSLHFRYGGQPDQMVANALFADGAAAAVVGANASHPGRWRIAAVGSVVLPDSEDAMTWQIGDHGFEMGLSSRVPELIARHLQPWLADWLAGSGLRIKDVAAWAIHPGGPRILQIVAEALRLPRGSTWASEEILAEAGNMSSPTTLFVLERLQRSTVRCPCVAMAFGPGLVAEAALLV